MARTAEQAARDMAIEWGTADPVHLHLDDYPATLGLLAELLDMRIRRGDSWDVGYEPTEHGAWVNWERLEAGPLSSTERAVARIAHGCATLEHHGGPSPRLGVPLRRTIALVTGGGTRALVPITCPKCGRTSHNPTDAAEGYCGACHEFTS